MGNNYTSGAGQEAAPESHGPSGAGLKIALVVSDFNSEITSELERGALEELKLQGVKPDDILTLRVPGAFELPLGAQSAFENALTQREIDAVICLGCVIRGETSHYDFICNSCASALQTVALKFGKPVIAGVLTTENIEQARARSGGARGHKGRESALAALAALKMVHALSAGESIESSIGSSIETSVEDILSSTVDAQEAG